MRALRTLSATVAFTLMVSTAARADETPTAVTLPEVIAAAAKAPSTQAVRHEIRAADALVAAAGAWPNPSLRVETNRLTAHLVTGATIPVPVFGTVGAERRLASAEAATVRSEALVNDREVRRRAVVAWIALAQADGEIAATATAATQAAELERIAAGRLDAGVGAEVDVTAARAARARADLAAVTATRTQQAASADLAGVLGWDPLKPLVAAGDLPGRETITIAALRAQLPAHPQRTVAQRKVAAADAAIAQIRTHRWPSLAFEAQVSAFDPTTPGTDVLVAVSLDLPVFAHIGDRVRAATETAAAERARFTATSMQLDADLIAAFGRWQIASEQLATLEKDILPAQERAALLSAQAYREGARDLASALQADRDLAAVRTELLAARTAVATAWVTLQEAAGGELIGPHAQ